MTTPIVITAITFVVIEVATTVLIIFAVLVACAALTDVHRTPRGGGRTGPPQH